MCSLPSRRAGGLALALGFEQLGALLIITFLVAVTPIMHWPIKNGQLDLHGARAQQCASRALRLQRCNANTRRPPPQAISR